MQGPWSGDVPDGWQIRPLWSEFRRGKTLGDGSEELLSVYRDYGVIPKSSREDNFNKPSEDLSKYQRVFVGDLVVNKMKAWQGSLGISNHDGIVSPAYFVYKATGTFERRFAHYLLRCKEYADHMAAISAGIRPNQWDLDPVQFAVTPLLVPPPEKQRAIADYLDRETSQIDAFIAKNEELIALLAERRASQIAQVVSRGLDASFHLVDAPKLALGTMPAHWCLTPLKRAVGYQEGPGVMAADFRDAGVPLLRISSLNTATATLDGCNFLDADLVRERWSHFQVAMGDLLISASASMGTIAEVATHDVVGAVPYTGIIRIIQGKMLRDFAKWFFISEEFLMQVEALKTGSTIQHFGPSHLGRMWVGLPPVSEQRAIAARLRHSTARIDESIRTAERGVALARERRAALVSAAVTGKIDVGVAV